MANVGNYIYSGRSSSFLERVITANLLHNSLNRLRSITQDGNHHRMRFRLGEERNVPRGCSEGRQFCRHGELHQRTELRPRLLNP